MIRGLMNRDEPLVSRLCCSFLKKVVDDSLMNRDDSRCGGVWEGLVVGFGVGWWVGVLVGWGGG